MATQANMHQRLFECWNRRDFDAYRELLHPEYSFEASDGRIIEGGPKIGVSMAKMYAAAFPDCVITVTNTVAAGNTLVSEFVARGTHGGRFMGIAATGEPVEIHCCNIVELRDGKIFKEREYVDTVEILKQIGSDLRRPASAPSHMAGEPVHH